MKKRLFAIMLALAMLLAAVPALAVEKIRRLRIMRIEVIILGRIQQ